MVASNTLKKQIIVELFVLIFFVFAVIYSYFAITKSQSNDIKTFDGMVVVLNDTNFNKLEVLSDGQGLKQNAISYAVTNNNEDSKRYNVIVYPDNHNEEILENIRISVDDIYVKTLADLERHNGGYVIAGMELESGYTKMHSIKLWYQKNMEISYTDVNFEYEIELV